MMKSLELDLDLCGYLVELRRRRCSSPENDGRERASLCNPACRCPRLHGRTLTAVDLQGNLVGFMEELLRDAKHCELVLRGLDLG